jgi:hypothetical protein
VVKIPFARPATAWRCSTPGRPRTTPGVVVTRLLDWLLTCHLAGWLEDELTAADHLLATDDVVGSVLPARVRRLPSGLPLAAG